jgi:hypothetical protein
MSKQIFTINTKYAILVNCPIPSKGYSTGFAPIQVKIKNIATVDQKFNFLLILNFEERDIFFLNGKIKITKIDMSKATTPPSLLGIERKIA